MPFQPPLPGMVPDTGWRPPRMSDLPSTWTATNRLSFDIETRDDHLKELGPGARRGGYITGYSFALAEDGPRFYVPLRHQGGDNIEEGPETGLRYLRDRFREYKGEIVGANLSYDIDFVLEADIEFPNENRFLDVQNAEALLNEHRRSYKLDLLCTDYGLPGKDTAALDEAARMYNVDPRGGMWRLPARHVGAYGEADADRPLRLLRLQEPQLEAQRLGEAWDIETRLLWVLAKMRKRGVHVNLDKLEAFEKWTLDQERDALDEIRVRTGIRLSAADIWKPTALLPLFDYLGVKVPRTGKGNPSIQSDWMEKIDHPAAEALRTARKMDHQRSNFVTPVRKHMVNGRIHCTFNQLRGDRDDDSGKIAGTISYRLSSEHVNMQNQPIRDPEIGEKWRDIYEPEDGALWASADFSQQEPRWAVHYADILQLEKAREVRNQYLNDPNTDFHQFMADLTGLPRKRAKNVFLGLAYGMGGAKLARELGLPTKWIQNRWKKWVLVAGDEAQQIKDTFDRKVPFIARLAKKCEQRAEEVGQIRTFGGYLRRFPTDANGNYDWTHKAFNALIQTSSAIQTKLSMLALDKAGYYLQLQVHDQNDASVSSVEEAREMGRIQSECVSIRVPSKVDVEVGPSFGQLEKVAE